MIFDADGLIKLNRAGILLTVAKAFRCLVPSEVYKEAVTDGLAMHHPDAIEIDEIVSAEMEIWSEQLATAGSIFGSGETAAMNLFPLLEDRVAHIVSDDKAFVRYLTQIGYPCIVPSDLIVRMVKVTLVTKQEALDALNKLRDSIQPSQLNRALEAINDYPTEG